MYSSLVESDAQMYVGMSHEAEFGVVSLRLLARITMCIRRLGSDTPLISSNFCATSSDFLPTSLLCSNDEVLSCLCYNPGKVRLDVS